MLLSFKRSCVQSTSSVAVLHAASTLSEFQARTCAVMPVLSRMPTGNPQASCLYGMMAWTRRAQGSFGSAKLAQQCSRSFDCQSVVDKRNGEMA